METTGFFGRARAARWRVSMLREAIVMFGGRRPKSRTNKDELVQILTLLTAQWDLDSHEGYRTWKELSRARMAPRYRTWKELSRARMAPRHSSPVSAPQAARVAPRFRPPTVHGSASSPMISAPIITHKRPSTTFGTPELLKTSLRPGLVSSTLASQANVDQSSITTAPVGNSTQSSGRPCHFADFTGTRAHEASTTTFSSGLAVEPRSFENTECTICFGNITPANRPQRRITATCEHEPDICRPCLAQSIASQIESKVWNNIDCPSCRARLTYEDIKDFADSSVFGRYDNHSLEACLSGPQFQRCRHPDCCSSQECFPEHDSYIICRECTRRTCISCDAVWHPDESCTSASTRRAKEAERSAEEKATRKYVASNAKRCPKCNAPGEKIGGCSHMTCKLASFSCVCFAISLY